MSWMDKYIAVLPGLILFGWSISAGLMLIPKGTSEYKLWVKWMIFFGIIQTLLCGGIILI